MTTISIYIDETGDRGNSGKSSPIFGMAAVLVPDYLTDQFKAAVIQLKKDFKVPEGQVMSWKEHVKNHDRRRYAAEVLSRVDGVKVCYAYADKSALREDSYKRDQERFYNYVSLKLFKGVLWAGAKSMGAKNIRVRFGHVRSHDHTKTEKYLRQEASRDPKIPIHLVSSLRWVGAAEYVESQAADLYAGFLKAALWPTGDFGYTEDAYLRKVWHQIRNSENCAIPLGIFPMPDYDVLTSKHWFPCRDNCPKQQKSP